jgi:hypothetical protein
MNKRYQVDERKGCAAVIDTLWPNRGNGLCEDDVWVIEYSALPSDTATNETSRKVKLCVLEAIADKLNTENIHTEAKLMELRRNLTNTILELEEVFARHRNYSKRQVPYLMC